MTFEARQQTGQAVPRAATNERASQRARSLLALANEQFDVLVVGGGATGVGIARDAVTRGLRVALVEAQDFASETSSHSSKLIHGGLRYLQYGDLRLVFEALTERRRLMRTAPHLCRPVEFIFPTYRSLAPRLRTLGAGIALYNALALWRAPVGGQRLNAREVLERVPGLYDNDLEGAQAYVDCQTNDARLVLEAALDASSAGALLLTRIRAVRLARNRAGTRVRGACVEDALTGAQFDVRATVVVNATGPFSDTFDRGRKNLRPTLGVHAVFRETRLPHGNRAIVLRSPRDGRLVFLLPAGQRTIVGTTDTDWSPTGSPVGSPPRLGDAIVAQASDVDYLLEVANHAFPSLALNAGDVISAYAGLRPLVAAPAHGVSETSREHEILVERDGLVTIVGGKLTTFRRMAEEVTDVVCDQLRMLGFESAIAPCSTAIRPLWGAVDSQAAAQASLGNVELAADVEEHLRATYGRRAGAVVTAMKESVGGVSLSERLYPDLPYIWAEILYAARTEEATDLEDLLRRRTCVFRDAADQGVGVAEQASRIIEIGLGWSPQQSTDAIERYRVTVARSRAWQAR